MFVFVDDDEVSSASHGKHAKKRKYGKKKRSSKLSRWWRSRKRWQKGLVITGVSLLLVVTIAAGVLGVMFRYNYNRISTNPEDLGFSAVIDKNILNIALFGIDSRDMKSFKGLSDSIMIMSLNTQTKKVKMISVMRDSLVPIEKDGRTRYTKINAAYSLGGPELAIKTLNQVFGLDISEYATVNFLGMADIIDAVGGIDVTLADGELDAYGYKNGKRVNYGFNGLVDQLCGYFKLDPSGYYIHQGGTYHLNGVQAVAYARIRHAANIEGTNNDYGRTDRQRYVMEQLFNKALTINKSQYAGLAKALIPCCETSLSYSEIMSLAVNILLNSPTFEQTRVPLTQYQMNNKSYVYYDLNYAGKLVRAFIYDDIAPETYMETNGIEKNDWYYGRSSGSGGSTANRSGSTGGASSGGTGSPVTADTPSEDNTGSENPTSSEPSDTSSEDNTNSEGIVPGDSSGGESPENPDNTEPGNEPGTEPGGNAGNSSGGESSGGSGTTESGGDQGTQPVIGAETN